MRVRYAVTFEFVNTPPVTHRGESTGGTAATCAHRAIREAQQHLRTHRWSSMNCVLLERLDADAETTAEDAVVPQEGHDGENDDEPAI